LVLARPQRRRKIPVGAPLDPGKHSAISQMAVSWYDAQAFVGWLNAKSGEDDAYHLP
jgi:formylglycine-generating enzyme required for sulfatase activity